MMEVAGTLLLQFDDATSGNAAAFTPVTVYRVDSSGNKTPAALYLNDDVDGPQRDNPFNTGPTGRYSFYVENGVYSIEWATGSLRVQAFDLKALNALAKGLEVVESGAATLSVTGADHAKWFILDNDEADEIVISVGQAQADVGAGMAPAPASLILFTQNTEVPVKFVSQFPGVVVLKSPGELRNYGRNSTVGIMAAGLNTWYLIGDIGTDFGATDG